ncbi:MAG: DUF3280 domain-containing protein [Rhodobacteraceae bacterium]|nr:DUF3280 domain-containing protein [Paracoccaceae bacterium]
MKPMMLTLLLACWPALAAAALDGPLKPGAKVTFLGLTFIDSSAEGSYNGPRADETARIPLLETEIRTRFAAEGFDLISTAPEAQRLEAIVNPANCYGCDVRMGARLGADYVLVGEVQKVSNLILSMNLVMRATDTGQMARGLSVDIRSNTDDSWLRGMRYILNNHFFKH